MIEQKDHISFNPLRDLISDDIYNLLYSRGFLNEKSIRNYIIRKQFESLKTQNKNVVESLYVIQKEYPYLQIDTIRKIVYNIN